MPTVTLEPSFHEAQQQVATSPARFRVVSAGRRLGKALDLDTPIPVPHGWTRMGDLAVGDLVFAPDGSPTRVVGAWETLHGRTCYRVVFGDGTSVVADAEHLWVTSDRGSRKAYGRAEHPTLHPKARTTEEIRDTLMVPRPDGKVQRNHSIAWPAPLDLPTSELQIDPYLFGVWLGDGSSAGGMVTTADAEIVAAFRMGGWVMKPHKSDPYSWYITSRDGRYRNPANGQYADNDSFGSRLKRLDVRNNKHIPQNYLRSSEAQRWELLGGLIDSDGSGAAGLIEITTTKPALRDGILELVRSLGMAPACYEGRATIDGRDCGPKWRVSFRPTRNPGKLARKWVRLADRPRRMIVAVEPVESRPVRCITVEHPSAQYLAGEGMIPTHNTRLGVTECIKVALEGGRAWWVAPTYTMAGEAWRPLAVIAREIPGCKVRVVDKEIDFPGGGLVQVRTADNPQRLRGAGLDFVVVDEAAYCNPDVWEQALRPALSDRKGRALFISTPKGIGNWFHTLWQQAADKDGWAQFQFPTVANPFIDPAEVEAAKADLGSLVFSQEYLGQFVELGGTLFKTEWARYAEEITKDGAVWYKCGDRTVDSREGFRFVTVDLAASTKQTADYTAIAACQQTQGVMVVLEVVRRRMEGPDILPEVRRVMAAHSIPAVHMESAGFQLALVQQARRDGFAVKELKADRDKIARALPLQARMEAGSVWFLPGPWLKELELELFGFPGSEHDDQVDALAYAAVVAGQSAKPKPGLEGLAGFGVRVSPNKP